MTIIQIAHEDAGRIDEVERLINDECVDNVNVGNIDFIVESGDFTCISEVGKLDECTATRLLHRIFELLNSR